MIASTPGTPWWDSDNSIQFQSRTSVPLMADGWEAGELGGGEVGISYRTTSTPDEVSEDPRQTTFLLSPGWVYSAPGAGEFSGPLAGDSQGRQNPVVDGLVHDDAGGLGNDVAERAIDDNVRLALVLVPQVQSLRHHTLIIKFIGRRASEDRAGQLRADRLDLKHQPK